MKRTGCGGVNWGGLPLKSKSLQVVRPSVILALDIFRLAFCLLDPILCFPSRSLLWACDERVRTRPGRRAREDQGRMGYKRFFIKRKVLFDAQVHGRRVKKKSRSRGRQKLESLKSVGRERDWQCQSVQVDALPTLDCRGELAIITHSASAGAFTASTVTLFAAPLAWNFRPAPNAF